MKPQKTEPYRIICLGGETASPCLAAALDNEGSIALTPAVSLPDDLSVYDAAVFFAGNSQQDRAMCVQLAVASLPFVYVGDLSVYQPSADAVLLLDDSVSAASFLSALRMLCRALAPFISEEFASKTAHDINNKLGGILQSAENAQRRLFDALPGNTQAAEKAGITLDQIAVYAADRNIAQYLSDIIEAGGKAAEITAEFRKAAHPKNA